MNPDIPDHLLTFNPDDWPGKHPGHVMSIDILVRRENWRRGQDAWAREHGLDRGQFEQLQRKQRARLTANGNT